MKPRNPIARVVKSIRPKIVEDKRGKEREKELKVLLQDNFEEKDYLVGEDWDI